MNGYQWVMLLTVTVYFELLLCVWTRPGTDRCCETTYGSAGEDFGVHVLRAALDNLRLFPSTCHPTHHPFVLILPASRPLVCASPPPPCVYYYKTDSTKSADRQTSLRPLRGGLDTLHTYYYLVEDTIRQKIKIKLIHPSIISHCRGASHCRLQCCEKQGWLMLPLAETPTRAQSC